MGLDDVKAVLIGQGSEERSVREQVTELGLSERFEFVGTKRNDELPVWYGACDATLLTSISEGIPNTLRESLACARPFVTTDVGGVRELGEGPGRIYVSGRCPNEFAHAVKELLHAPSNVPFERRDWLQPPKRQAEQPARDG